MFNVKDYQDDIDNIAHHFVNILERAASATGSDLIALEATGQTIIAAIVLAIDAEKTRRFGTAVAL